MTKENKFTALREAKGLEFWGNKSPKCPHCGHDYDIQEREARKLYEEGGHEIECPSCDLEYNVDVNISYTYNTDEQEEDE